MPEKPSRRWTDTQSMDTDLLSRRPEVARTPEVRGGLNAMINVLNARGVDTGPTNAIAALKEAADQAEEAEEEETLDPHREATVVEKTSGKEAVEDAMTTGGSQKEDVAHHHQTPDPERMKRREIAHPTTRSVGDQRTAAEASRRSVR